MVFKILKTKKVTIKARNGFDFVVRLLMMFRKRRFDVQDLKVNYKKDDEVCSVVVQVGEKDLEQLVKQSEKLIDVVEVT
ncbi:ACT domain-containing protein [Patescibacteria group bacterium]|nr:ACT domain-containing protein [Patescibacteria group bacterium]